MWPKTGETVTTQKSTYVMKVPYEDGWLMVGCGVYLADAPKGVMAKGHTSSSQLMKLVNEAAEEFKAKGETAFTDFRNKGTKWFSNETYFFAFSKNGTRTFHAMEPQTEGRNDIALRDVLGRPIVKMFLDAGFSKAGEGWVHYMWPEPGEIFPSWKSAYVKRVTFPSGKQYIIGSGIYNMQLDKMFIEDMVNRASSLVAEQGAAAFPLLRDKKGPFVFMNTYVFVDNREGVELVNGGQPAIEGKNLWELQDLRGKYAMKEYMSAALEKGDAWVEYYWYKPWTNEPARKMTYVKKVQHGNETYVVGAGYFPVDDENKLAKY
ncbi:MAG TPA: cache domain-containing protein, partial [Chitinophagaceae bacterium]